MGRSSCFFTWGTSILLLYGFVKEFRPSVPYLNLYLVNASSAANLTDDILNSQVYPVSTYSYMLLLIPVMLVTDWLLYTPIIMSEALSLAAVWALLLWGSTVFHMQIMQAVFGWASAAEVAYFSYIYAAVPATVYQKVTSLVRMVTLLGKCCAYGLGQILMSLKVDNALKLVTHVSFGSVCLAFFVAAFLPRVQRKSIDTTAASKMRSFTSQFSKFSHDFKKSFGNPQVQRWSLWWAFSTCLWCQILNYIQLFWADVDARVPKNSKDDVFSLSQDYNGIVECVTQLLGVASAWVVQFLLIDWNLYGELIVGSMCLCQTCCLALCLYSSSLAPVYVCYLCYCVFYQAGITIATYNVARHVQLSSHGLIFGANTFFALLMQTALTAIVVNYLSYSIVGYTIRNQFVIYTGLQCCLTFLFLVMGFFTWAHRSKHGSLPVTIEQSDSKVLFDEGAQNLSTH